MVDVPDIRSVPEFRRGARSIKASALNAMLDVCKRTAQRTPFPRRAGGDTTLYAVFAVKVWQDGGTTDGDASNPCDRTYKARTLPATGPTTGGELLGSTLTPKERRPICGKLDVPPTTGAGVIGWAYYDETDAFCLADANETLAVVIV